MLLFICKIRKERPLMNRNISNKNILIFVNSKLMCVRGYKSYQINNINNKYGEDYEITNRN